MFKNHFIEWMLLLDFSDRMVPICIGIVSSVTFLEETNLLLFLNDAVVFMVSLVVC